ncbi:putative RING-variant domain-containing protein [Ordospora pajunii]|uniref:putative RING-variant domain-containing protein n=1 Tax=Ordospora pajunii TaxID=3039483 RepID=UPI00295273FA|nr:putative RING-variant domain-containing protein [Ordospora pajunii]KAH9411200.1 putative RING-variant domain-containing protein [Ordospora pajunii]
MLSTDADQCETKNQSGATNRAAAALEEGTEGDMVCKICYSLTNPVNMKDDLISPCDCRGSIGLVHEMCLKMWRYRGKRVKNIRTCEQCCSLYRMDGEVMPRASAVFFIALSLFIASYFISTVVLRSFMNTAIITIRELFYMDRHGLGNQVRKNLEDAFSQRQPTVHDLAGERTLMYIFVVVVVYQIASRTSFLSIFNYMFTFWRLSQFSFVIDRILFFAVSGYYIKKVYNEIYHRIDTWLFFLLNAR